MIGAGIAIVVTETVVGIYLFFNCFKLLDYSSNVLKKYFLKPTIATIIMFLVTFQVPNMFVGIPLGTLIYFAVLYLMKGIPENLVASAFGIVKSTRDRWRTEKNSLSG